MYMHARSADPLLPDTDCKPRTVSVFKNFCKEEESLDDEESSGLPSEVDNSQLRALTLADSHGLDAYGKDSKGHSLASAMKLDRPTLRGFPGS